MAERLFHVGVKALIRNKERKLLLLYVNADKFTQSKKAYWDIPGGRIQEGDTIEDTLLREIKEETGINRVKGTEFFTSTVSNIEIPIGPNQKVGLVLMVYSIEAETLEVSLSDEHVAYEWVSSQEAADRLKHKYPAEFTDRLS